MRARPAPRHLSGCSISTTRGRGARTLRRANLCTGGNGNGGPPRRGARVLDGDGNGDSSSRRFPGLGSLGFAILASTARSARPAVASASSEGEEAGGTDDVSRLKRLLRNTLRDVTRLNDRLDDVQRQGDLQLQGSASGPAGAALETQEAGRGVVVARTSLEGSFVIDDEKGKSAAGVGGTKGLLSDIGVDCESGLAVSLTSSPRPGDATLKAELGAAAGPAQEGLSKLELRKVLVETSLSRSTIVKFSPLGCSASDLLMALHPLLGSGLTRVTRQGSTLLQSCQGMMLSASWTSRKAGASVLRSLNSFAESSLGGGNPTHTVGQLLLRVLDNFVVCSSTKVTSLYRTLDMETRASERGLKSLGWNNQVTHSLGAAATLSEGVILSGWATFSSGSREVQEWWVGATNLAGQEEGWGLCVCSPQTSATFQLEAFVKQSIGGVQVSPGLIYLPTLDRKVLMLSAKV